MVGSGILTQDVHSSDSWGCPVHTRSPYNNPAAAAVPAPQPAHTAAAASTPTGVPGSDGSAPPAPAAAGTSYHSDTPAAAVDHTARSEPAAAEEEVPVPRTAHIDHMLGLNRSGSWGYRLCSVVSAVGLVAGNSTAAVAAAGPIARAAEEEVAAVAGRWTVAGTAYGKSMVLGIATHRVAGTGSLVDGIHLQ